MGVEGWGVGGGSVGSNLGHAQAEYLFVINKRKFPGGGGGGVWGGVVVNEKNPSSKKTHENTRQRRSWRRGAERVVLWRGCTMQRSAPRTTLAPPPFRFYVIKL